MNRGANAKVRTELGGDEAGRRRAEELQSMWPRQLVAHCDTLRARGMSDTTFEALMTAVGWRTDRGVPEYARPPKPKVGRKFVTTGTTYSKRQRLRTRSRARALQRLKLRHPDEYRQLYTEERLKEQDV